MNLDDVFNDAEQSLVVEGLGRLLAEKMQAHKDAGQYAAAMNLSERDFGIPQINALLERFGQGPDAELDGDALASPTP